MSDRKPQPGDRVRVTYEGLALDDAPLVGDDGTFVDVAPVGDPSTVTAYVPGHATVEVLEPADDPRAAPVGQVRQEDAEGGHIVWQMVENERGKRRWLCVHSTFPGMRGTEVAPGGAWRWPVIGAVPGTPAAEAQQPHPPEDDGGPAFPPIPDPHEPVVLVRQGRNRA